MTHTADALALLAAIAQFPDDDTPRLMLADCLEDNGEPERAEFIRLQIRLAHPPWNSKDMLRAAALLKQYEARWRAAGPCPKCGGSAKLTNYQQWNDDVTTRKEWEVDCPACFGTGDRGGLTARVPVDGTKYDWRYPVHFSRGFISRVECPRLADALAEAEVTCPKCGGDGAGEPGSRGLIAQDCADCAGTGTVRRLAPTPWLRAVLDATAAPERALVAEVVPLCRVPYHLRQSVVHDDGQYLFQWYDVDEQQHRPYRVPFAVIERMEKQNLHVHSGDCGNGEGKNLYYRTSEAAVSALGRAIVALARA